ncbi:MAG: Smr/MutS family protein [Bacilli bacterium]|nr:Smr/MutS family protein [Bacilli bacterium]
MIMLYDNLPSLDLHGIDRDYAKILINEFIKDNYKIKNNRVIIIHGIGTGIIKKTTQETLKKNTLVENFKIDNFNPGITVVNIVKKP